MSPRLRTRPPTAASTVATWLVAGYALVQGVVITWAGDNRFASPGYMTVRDVPGGMDAWGVALFAAGILVTVGVLARSWWAKTVGLYAVFGWAFFLGLGFLHATILDEDAGPTGPATYLAFAFITLCLVPYDSRRPSP